MNRRKLLTHGGILLAIFLIGFGPLLISLAAGAFASINGCALNEGSANPCIVFGVDWGDTLYSMGVMGWISIASLPVAFLFFLVYLGVLVVGWFRKRSAAS